MAEDNKIHHLGWFLAGLGVGAVVGILYAPKSGRETREDIAAEEAGLPAYQSKYVMYIIISFMLFAELHSYQ